MGPRSNISNGDDPPSADDMKSGEIFSFHFNSGGISCLHFWRLSRLDRRASRRGCFHIRIVKVSIRRKTYIPEFDIFNQIKNGRILCRFTFVLIINVKLVLAWKYLLRGGQRDIDIPCPTSQGTTHFDRNFDIQTIQGPLCPLSQVDVEWH